MRRVWLLILTITLSAGILPAQQASLAGPVEGFTFDAPTQSIRAITGMPGSALFGPALATGFDSGWVAPHANYAVAFLQGAYVLVSGLDSATVTTTALDGGQGQAESIAWSADGSVAVLFSRSSNWLQVLSGLPAAPQFGPAVDLSTLGGALAGVAADPHGQNIAVAVQGSDGGIFLLAGPQSFTPLIQMANPQALTFSEDGSTLYILDGATLQLLAAGVQDGSVQALALDGLQDPSAIASGRDLQGRQVVYIASGSDQILRLYDPAAQQVLVDLPLDFPPTSFTALGRHSFALSSRAQASDPLWVFEGAPQPAVYFIPAAQPAGGLD